MTTVDQGQGDGPSEYLVEETSAIRVNRGLDAYEENPFRRKSQKSENGLSLAYLASPYNHDDPVVMEERFTAACVVAGRLIQSGVCVFSPIAHNVPILQKSGLKTGWETWPSLTVKC